MLCAYKPCPLWQSETISPHRITKVHSEKGLVHPCHYPLHTENYHVRRKTGTAGPYGVTPRRSAPHTLLPGSAHVVPPGTIRPLRITEAP